LLRSSTEAAAWAVAARVVAERGGVARASAARAAAVTVAAGWMVRLTCRLTRRRRCRLMTFYLI